uniref:F-box domain-containing protein n=1 Tax=Amorphochlora amoebiformis TaxID=1561963 RepID=A0A7S0DHB3_9EUKA
MLEVIMGMLDPRSLARCTAVSRRWNSLARSGRLWHSLCRLRWKIKTPISRVRVYGDKSWMKVYHSLADRMRMPKGYYTGQRSRVFAFGRHSGVDLWVSVAHRSDCSLVSNPDGGRMVRLRITIQNTHHATVQVNTKSTGILLLKKCGTLENAIGDHKTDARCIDHYTWKKSIRASRRKKLAPRIVALNGRKVERLPGQTATLGPLGFTVIEAYMAGRECFEPEFLERCLRLQLKGRATTSSKGRPNEGSKWYPIAPIAQFCDDGEIWKHFSRLPGGCMYLNDLDEIRDQERQEKGFL